MFNKTIELNECVSILNKIAENYVNHDLYEEGLLFLDIKKSELTETHLKLIFFDTDDLDEYMNKNSEPETDLVDLSELWRLIENHYDTELIFMLDNKEFIEKAELMKFAQEHEEEIDN